MDRVLCAAITDLRALMSVGPRILARAIELMP
jgi:hypothetical protein